MRAILFIVFLINPDKSIIENVTTLKLRPKALFFGLWLIFYLVFSIFEMLHRDFGWLTPGTIFLTQLLALYLTTIVAVIKSNWHTCILPWIITCFISLLLIVFSFGRFLPNELSDIGSGPAIHYGCLRGESDGSVIAIFGETYTNANKENIALTVCVLKNLPLAASGGVYNAEESVELYMFLIFEGFLLSSFIICSRLSSVKSISKENNRK